MKLVLVLLSLFAVAGACYAQETSHFAFVSEYVRELGVIEDIRTVSEAELLEDKAKGGDSLATGIRSSTRVQLELKASIELLNRMHLNPPFEKTVGFIIGFYEQKIEMHQKLIDIASKFLAGPEPNVDYGKLASESPKITASLEFIDKSLFEAIPLIFATLIDQTPDRQGHLSRLVITKEQRGQLIGKLSDRFGTKLDEKKRWPRLLRR